MNVIYHESQQIEGVNNVPVNQLQIISNGYVEKLTLYCMDNMVSADRLTVCNEAAKKIKVGGEMLVRFTNLDLVQKQIASGDLSSEKYSAILPTIQSVWSEKDFHSWLDNIGYDLDSQHYEGIYTVATIRKK